MLKGSLEKFELRPILILNSVKEASENGNSDGSTGSKWLIMEEGRSEVRSRGKWKTLEIQKVNVV